MPATIRVKFPGHNNLLLDGRLEMPDDEPLHYATFSHCFTCSKDLLSTFRISKHLAAHGIATLRFDFAGLGGSEGNFADTTFSTNMRDLQAAAGFLEQHYRAPDVLIGHSLGGTTALACAAGLNDVKAVVTIAAPSQPQHVLHHFGAALQQLEAGDDASIVVAGDEYHIRPQFVHDLRQHDMRMILSQLHKPVLIFNIAGDTVVGEHNAREIQQWCAGASTLINLQHTDHVLSGRKSAGEVAICIAEFLGGQASG